MKIIVNAHKCEIDKSPVNELEINITKCEFEFAEEITSEFVKEAYFTLNHGETYKQIIVNNECNIPGEVLEKQGTVEIGVVAKLVEGTTEIKRYNPRPAYFDTWQGSLRDAENSEPITPSEFDQYEQALQDGLSEVNQKLADIDQAIEDVNEAITETNNLDLDVDKQGKVATVTLTKKDASTKVVTLSDGTSLMFNWDGTKLGIKTDEDAEYTYVDLQGVQGPIGPKGEAFTIKKTYTSVAEMNADFNNMQLGDYVMIASTVEVEDNAKLYTRGESQWIFISDFSGATGIRGETGLTPNIQIGTVTSGETPNVTRTGTNENPVLNFTLVKGDKGDTGSQGIQGETGNGIASITKTSSEGLVDTYTITYTDGTTSTFQITNGEDGSVTPTEFNSLKTRVEDLEDNQITLPAEGTNIHVEDAAKARLYEFEMDKESTQETTQGTNLIGLNTNKCSVNLTVGDKITVTNNSENERRILFYTNIEDTEYNDYWTILSGQTRTVTVGYNSKAIAWNFVIQGGLAWANLGNTALPYEEYTGGQPSPNPDYPQEVKTVKGYRNLFDENTIYNYTFDTSTGKVIKRDDRNAYVASVKPNTTYVISRSVATSTSRIAYLENFAGGNSYNYIDIINISSNLTYSFTTPANCNYVMFLVGAAVATNLQLTEGDQELPYVPYGNNYVDVRVIGKNLLNINSEYIKRNTNGSMTISENVITLTNNTTTQNAYGWILPVEINKEITISFSDINPIVTYATVYYAFIQEPISSITELNLGYVVDKTQKYATVTSTTNYLLVYIRVPQTTFTVSNLMVSYSNDLKYEPYQESNVPIPLNNNEIVGIGNYKDELLVDKSGHVWLNKKTGKKVFDGSETWNIYNTTSTSVRFRTEISDIEEYKTESSMPNLLCNRFIPETFNATWKIGNISRTIYSSFEQSVIFIYNLNTSLADWKTWLSTHNTEVYYVLAAPELIDLQTKVDLKLFKGVNNITNSEDGNMSIRYVESIESIINDFDARLQALEGTEL